MLGSRKVLGVAFEERYAVISEVCLARGARRVEQAVEFQFPADAGWTDARRLGKALGQFLRQKHFSANRAVAGLPAKWLMARELNVPPAGPAETADIVRLEAEREFAPDPTALGMDYADALDGREARPVLLVGALRERLNEVRLASEAAGLKLLAVTSSALAVSSEAMDSAAAVGITLVLRPGNLDLVARSGGQFCAVRHVVVPDAADASTPLLAALEMEIRRALGTVARSHAQGGAAEVTIWDGIGLPADALGGMSARLGLEVKGRSQLPQVSLQPGQAEAPASTRFVSATALGICALNGHRPAIDLLHSRLAPPQKKLLGRRAWLAAGAAAAVAAVVFAMVFGWQKEQAGYVEEKQTYDKLAPQIDKAQSLEDKIGAARDWYTNRPRLLDCLLIVAQATPERVWCTKVVVKPILLAQRPPAGAKLSAKAPAPKKMLDVALSGVASDEPSLLQMTDRLARAKGVSAVKKTFSTRSILGSTRNNIRAGVEVIFTISFYVAAE